MPPEESRDPREVLQLIEAANAVRRRTAASTHDQRHTVDAEARLDSLFRTGERLAVYGSLAPGRQNHHIVAPLGGTWSEGVVEGELTAYGWGAAVGYPALTLRPGGPAVPVHVLTSAALRDAWDELDAFEGAEYRRVLAPIWSHAERGARTLLAVANLYEAAG